MTHRPAARSTTPHIQQKRTGKPRRKKGRLYPPDAQPTWSQAVAWVDLSDAELAALGQDPAKRDWQRVTDAEREAIGHGLEAVLGLRATPKCLEAVITVANHYRVCLTLIDGKPRAAQQRATLATLRDHTDTLLEALQSLDDASRVAFAGASGFNDPTLGYLFMGYTWEDLCGIRTTAEVVSWTYTLQEEWLTEFAHRLHAVCKYFPYDDPKGRHPEETLKAYVQHMADIYEQLIGQQARITHNPYNPPHKVTTQTYTEFWKFLQASFRPIDPERCDAPSFVPFARGALAARRTSGTVPRLKKTHAQK